MPKAQSLNTSAESNLRDRVLDEVEKKSFISFMKGVTVGSCVSQVGFEF